MKSLMFMAGYYTRNARKEKRESEEGNIKSNLDICAEL